jgi:phosphoribosylglycinamide formyltransferase 2
VELEREFEAQGSHTRIIPTARAAWLTMDREGIRRLAAETLELPVSEYRFVDTLADYRAAVVEVGIPCVVKPVMSSSGHGQSLVRGEEDIQAAWDYAQTGGRAGAGRVIVEGFVDFDYEITLLTVRHAGGTTFCEPIGHLQRDGDYRESWQPQPMSTRALAIAQGIARQVTDALGGWGVFGVEFFVKDDAVWFSEVSPRPHDTGLVTLVSQDLSEFALHARAILGLPIPCIRQMGPSASCALLAEGHGVPVLGNVEAALQHPDTALRLFGKPRVAGHRRVGVTLARGEDIDTARRIARDAASALTIELHDI